jgi:hypothetical protein
MKPIRTTFEEAHTACLVDQSFLTSDLVTLREAIFYR